MFKGKLVFLVLAAALLCWQIMPAGVNDASSGIVDPVNSTSAGVGCCYIVCPQGDGTRFDDPACNAIISLTARDVTNTPIVGILAADIWLIGQNNWMCLCGGSGSINADSNTSAAPAGYTTISGDISAGGYDTGLYVVVQGVVIGGNLPYWVVSPDINCDLIVDLIDLALFAPVFLGTVAYNPAMDYDCDSIIGLIDFAIFGMHYLHSC